MACWCDFPKARRSERPFAMPACNCGRADLAQCSRTGTSARVICISPLSESENGEAIARLVHRESAASRSPIQQTFAYRIAHQFLNCIAHRTRAKFRVKSLSHEERQHGRAEF